MNKKETIKELVMLKGEIFGIDCDSEVKLGYVSAMNEAIEAVKAQEHTCNECANADHIPTKQMRDSVYCLEHSCFIRNDNCCRDWSEEK